MGSDSVPDRGHVSRNRFAGNPGRGKASERAGNETVCVWIQSRIRELLPWNFDPASWSVGNGSFDRNWNSDSTASAVNSATVDGTSLVITFSP